MANSVDPDETPHSAASHLGLYCLPKPVCLNIYGKYGIHVFSFYNNDGFYSFRYDRNGNRYDIERV